MDKPIVMRSHDRVEKLGVRRHSIDKKLSYDLYAETGDIDWDTKPFIKTVKGATVLKNIKNGTYDIRNFDHLSGCYFMNKEMIIRSHHKIEESGVFYYYVEEDLDYDLYETADEEEEKQHGPLIKTVKGSTVLRNIENGTYIIANCIHVTNPIARMGRYTFDVDYDKKIIHKLGIIDLTGSSAVITDKNLNRIRLTAQKIDNKHFSIGVNNIVIDFVMETNKFFPSAMYMPSEENLLTVKIGDRKIYKGNMLYNGRIEKVELQRLDETYMLEFRGRCDESGPHNGIIGGTITLEQGVV